MVTGKFEEVQDFVTMWNYSYDIMMLNVSDKIWQTLSDEDKAILNPVGRKPARLKSLLPEKLIMTSEKSWRMPV